LVEQVSPAAHGEDHARADNHTSAPGGLHSTGGGYALKELWSMERPHRGWVEGSGQKGSVLDFIFFSQHPTLF